MKKLLSITAISCLLSGCAGFTNLPNSNANLNTYNQGSYSLNEQDKRDLEIIIVGAMICRDSKSKLASEWNLITLDSGPLSDKLNHQDRENILSSVVVALYKPYIIKKGMPQANDSLTRLMKETNPKIKYEIAMAAQKEYKANCGHEGLSWATNRFKQISANVR